MSSSDQGQNDNKHQLVAETSGLGGSSWSLPDAEDVILDDQGGLVENGNVNDSNGLISSPSISGVSMNADPGESSFTIPSIPVETKPTERAVSARTAAVVNAAENLERSDSILSKDEDESDEDAEDNLLGLSRPARASSIQYIEDASMEASILTEPLPHSAMSGIVAASSSADTSGTGEDEEASGGSPRSFTKIHASGSMGRRRVSGASESEMILVPMPDSSSKDLDNSFDVSGHTEDGSTVTGSSSRCEGMDQSERDVFRPVSNGTNQTTRQPSFSAQSPPPPPPPAPQPINLSSLSSLETVADILDQNKVLSGVEQMSDAQALHGLFEGFSTPTLDIHTVQAVLQLEEEQRYCSGDGASNVSFPEPLMVIVMNGENSRVVDLLTAGYPNKPALLRLPTSFALAFLRLLIRILSGEDDAEYNLTCFFGLPWKQSIKGDGNTTSAGFSPLDLSGDDPEVNMDHVSQRPHLLYSSARFQCSDQWSLAVMNDGMEQPALAVIWNLWEHAALGIADIDRKRLLLPPLARLLGLIGAAGMTPQFLRRMLTAVQNRALVPVGRLAMVRAVRTAAAAASRPVVLSKQSPKHFFSLGGAREGMRRTISGLSVWPFRNDFGLSLWFRVESFDPSRYPVLLSTRSDDGGGIDVSLVPLGRKTSDACTVQVSAYNSRKGDIPVKSVVVGGCVLVPRVWHHLAVRHTRSRLKGVFSLSTRQQLTIMLDGKTMLSESLVFPKIAGVDDRDEGASSLLQTGLRRSSGHTSINVTFTVGADFDGQLGSLYLFNDNVSDATFRALYEATGGSTSVLRKLSIGQNETWDARRSDIVRKSKVLDVNIKHDDAEEIVLSQRRHSGSHGRILVEKKSSVIDFGEGDEFEDSMLPTDLQNSSFGSKIFLVWDPRRSLDSVTLEVHLGAHLNTENVRCWGVSAIQDGISSVGGVQSLVPLFKSVLLGDSDRSRSSSIVGDLKSAPNADDIALSALAISDLFKLLKAFIQDHHDNARELLRCGGIDVIEQHVYTHRRMTSGTLTLPTRVLAYIARTLVESLLELRTGCSHYVGLETKVFSRLLFNIPLWLAGTFTPSVSELQEILLPVLSSLTKANPEKVRDCIGIKDMVHALKEYLEEQKTDDQGDLQSEISREGQSSSALKQSQVADVLLGMIFEVLSSGVSPRDLSPFLHFLSFNLECEWNDSTSSEELDRSRPGYRKERQRITVNSASVFLFLLQIRPPVPGLFESFAHCCGSVQSGVAWILSAMVNSHDDHVRSLGVRCVHCYLDVTSRGPDSPLSIMSTLPAAERDISTQSDAPSSMKRLGLLAKGLAAMGPGVRSLVIPPSKLTPRVVVKLLWHLLRTHRKSLGAMTRSSILCWISDDDGILFSSISSSDFLRAHLLSESKTDQPGYQFCADWANEVLSETGNIVGRSLRGPLMLGALLRLLRYLDGEMQDQWLEDLITLVRSSRRSTSLLSSLPDWQPSLFHLISETLDLLTSISDSSESAIVHASKDEQMPHGGDKGILSRRLDQSLSLYSILLGFLVREGGDKALEAVERATSLQRVCVNGHDVIFLIISSLCADIFDSGTLLEMGAISAEDWKIVNIEQESLPLKQSARLVTDAILSNGTKGLDLTTAVRSWRSLRHLTELIVALVIKSGFGVVDLFDYINQKASSVDVVSGGLNGIRLPDSRLAGIGSSNYQSFVLAAGGRLHSASEDDIEFRRDLDRRMCAHICAQILSILDAFIFPDSLDEALPASQLHGLALVRNSEPRLGTSQGPLVSSAIRLSLALLSLLEPCSVRILQCASRMKCLLYWALELIREKSDGKTKAFDESTAPLDRVLLATVIHCHRALSRCSALLSEIESCSFDKYFDSRESQKKHYRRLLRVSLELRDVVLTVYRGRNDVLKVSLSTEAFDALREGLEGVSSQGKSSSKESVIRRFLSCRWVSGFQDVETRRELSVPEQLSMDTIPISSDYHQLPSGFAVVEALAAETSAIVSEFEASLNSCFEDYLETQKKWAETEAVRDLEFDGDSCIKRLSQQYASDTSEQAKTILVRRSGADNRWRGIVLKAVEPWIGQLHWRLARYTDRMGRRTLLVQNRNFCSHTDASYELMLEKEREKAEKERRKREDELSEVMRRNAEAFVGGEITDESGDDDSSVAHASDGESSTDLESSTGDDDDDSFEPDIEESPHEDEWDKIDTEEIKDVDAEGDIDAWAKAFIWSESESVVARFDQVLILSLQSHVSGKILLTTHGLYFHQEGDEISVMTKQPIDTDNAASDTKDRRWRLTRLTEIHGRRHMLRPQALELFFSDCHELFLIFPNGVKERDRFHAKLRNSCKVPMLWSPKSLNPRTVFRKSKLTDLWKKRKISNFEYLMRLNRIAGRSFNDITQYPVFPWILADFTSDTIDLTDSRVYRDLSKPIGALNPDRLAQLLERYKDLELFGFTEAEKFLYGSHYSSPGIVLHYLIRQEPFTTMAIELQSGRFDCPDRLFFDIAGSWNGCLTSTSDMKELIPEFFCLPEMFLNTNNFPLGRTQTGRPIDNVGLPPWAKGSPFEFVRIHRLALESEYVSRNLHNWIDLVFGYKQRGPEAETAHNIFHHLSYEGSVDLDKIADEVDRQAAESHIQNFGQTPSQLSVLDPHPTRYGAEECWKPLISSPSVAKNLRCHTPSKQFGNKSSDLARGSVLQIHVLADTIYAVYEDLSIGSYRWLPKSKTNRLAMEKLRPLPRRELSTSRAAMKRGSAVSAKEIEQSSRSVGNSCFAFTVGGLAKEDARRRALLPSNRLISTVPDSTSASGLFVSCGYWDDTVKVHAADNLRVVASETGGHRGPIRCLAIGQDGGLMVTGGQDSTCRVWVVDHPDMGMALSDGYVQTALGASNDGGQVLSCCHVLWGHDTAVVAIDLDSDLDAVVSGSVSGLICVHTLRRGEFIRSFRAPVLQNRTSGGAVSKLALDTTGTMCIHMQDDGLHSFTVNAVRLCSTNAGEQLTDMKICSRGEMLVTGGSRCQVLIRTVADLSVCAKLDLSQHGPIRCISLTPDDLNPSQQFLFIGSDDGMITIVDEDPSKKEVEAETVSF